MVEGLLHPLNIFIVGLGVAFLIPLLYRLGANAVAIALVLTMAAMTLIAGAGLVHLTQGGAPIDILTGGAKPPVAINLRLGLPEAVFVFSVNLVALFGAIYVAREKYGAVLIYLLLVMGIQGMVMTRDLFNLFVFLEIVSIATYGLLSLRDTPAALSASFKYLMATVLASGFFLIGTVLLYAVTGLLNIDGLIENRASISGPIGVAALIFLLACLLLELKPFPANGWGLDVYETARPDVAALISGGVSAGVFFALLKLLPLFKSQLTLIAALGAVTFIFSNLIGLRQTKTQRLLGYSSIGQMSLLTIAAALLHGRSSETTMLLVIGGLFVNHLFAKVGLFWLAGHIGKVRLRDWPLARHPGAIAVFGILIVAISGLPPFPGFFAKWQLILTLADDQRYVFIAIILLGSLLEAAYMFRWFSHAVHREPDPGASLASPAGLIPPYGMALLLIVSGGIAAWLAGVEALWIALPLACGLAIWLVYRLPARIQGLIALALVLIAGLWLIRDLSGIAGLYSAILLAGGLVVSIGSLYRSGPRRGFYPMLAVLLASLSALPRASTSLEFLFVWELITLSSYFLVLMRRDAITDALRYLLFSLAAAFFLLAGFTIMHAATGSLSLSAFRTIGPHAPAVFVLVALGFLIKAGAAGVHVWLPGTYAKADDDISALLSAVVSKVAIFGLLVGTYIAIRSEAGLGLTHVLGWIGMLTTLVGALLAVRQDDIKLMLAYSSMSQLGYIVAAIALMSHLGWVTALYLVANHLLVKGILFLVAAAVILRTGTRLLSELGGLRRAMPHTFVLAAIAIVAMSGLPPLAGFGGKWLLLSAMMEKGWYAAALMTLLATFVGFLYMARFMQAIFLGQARGATAAEAPVGLLIPQYLLAAGILTMTFFPKLLIDPVSAAIDPQFASTLRWDGMSLELIYAYWNPVPVMAFAVTIAAILLGLLWLVHRSRPLDEITRGIYGFAQAICAALTPPLARRLWSELIATTAFAAERSRRIYTGNGQLYNLYIVYYVLVLYALGGGAQQIRALALPG